jgi:hypothetical protein
MGEALQPLLLQMLAAHRLYIPTRRVSLRNPVEDERNSGLKTNTIPL